MIRPVLMLVISTLLLIACNNHQKLEQTNSKQTQYINANGELASATSIFIGPPSIQGEWNFTIAYMAPDGQTIKNKSPIVKFDDQKLQAKLLTQNAQLEQKRKELGKHIIAASDKRDELILKKAELKTEFDKAKVKAEQPVYSVAKNELLKYKLDYEYATTALDLHDKEYQQQLIALDTETSILEAEVRDLELKVKMTRKNIDRMTILAPRDGIVMRSRDRRGNTRSTGDSVWIGQRVVELPGLDALIVKLEINERDAGSVDLGQDVQVTLDASPEQRFYGKITELGRVFRTKSRTNPAVVFDAQVTLTNPDSELMRPGMAVNAKIDISGLGTELSSVARSLN